MVSSSVLGSRVKRKLSQFRVDVRGPEMGCGDHVGQLPFKPPRFPPAGPNLVVVEAVLIQKLNTRSLEREFRVQNPKRCREEKEVI